MVIAFGGTRKELRKRKPEVAAKVKHVRKVCNKQGLQ
jgi:hypothetical protein